MWQRGTCMTRFEQATGVYVIAEIGINHNGSLDEARRLLRAAVATGADAVKIQVRRLDALYTRDVLTDSCRAEQGTQYLLNEIRRSHLDADAVRELFADARQFDVDFFATPFDIPSAQLLHELKTPLFKIGSPDFTNLPLLDVVTGFGKPMILSTGMAEEDEILRVIAFLKSRRADFALLHCNSTYPASPQTIHLNYLSRLRELSGVRVGYSGHERGFAPTLAAVALGATIIERHITGDCTQQGPDHSASLTPAEFAQMVQSIREIEQSLGKPERIVNQGERNNRLALGKSLVTACDLPAGTVLKREHLAARSPAKGISPLEMESLVGRTLNCDLPCDAYILPGHVERSTTVRKRDFSFNKRWGIVGRLNDFREFLSLKPDLIEIHMTWRDLLQYERPEQTFTQDLVVHAPEYYQDRLIDFTSDDPAVIELSRSMLERTIHVVRDLAVRFRGMTDPRGPRIVVHPGGHFQRPTNADKHAQYARLKQQLKDLDTSGVRILVENMPPLPWYFGGQWYNTVFMDAREIGQFAGEMGWEVCFDTSHAQLYCRHAGIELADFTRAILPHVGYLHIADARGATEEGLQIGYGEIDFEQLWAILGQLDVGFIPEIWQGHLHGGRGFVEALESLQALLKKVAGTTCDERTSLAHPALYQPQRAAA